HTLAAGTDALAGSHTGSGDATRTLLTITGEPGVSPVGVSRASLPINAWSAAPGAEQAGSSVLIETNDERVITAAWQNGSLWLGGNEACTPSGDTATRACRRLVELDTLTSIVVQDITCGRP